MKITGLGIIILWGAMLLSWGLNIYKITQLDFEPSYKAEIIRGVGIVPPIGAVVAWFDIGEEVKEK